MISRLIFGISPNSYTIARLCIQSCSRNIREEDLLESSFLLELACNTRNLGSAAAESCLWSTSCFGPPGRSAMIMMRSVNGERANFQRSFSAVSKPNEAYFSTKYSFDYSRRDLPNALRSTILKPQKSVATCLTSCSFVVNILYINLFRNFLNRLLNNLLAKFDEFC